MRDEAWPEGNKLKWYHDLPYCKWAFGVTGKDPRSGWRGGWQLYNLEAYPVPEIGPEIIPVAAALVAELNQRSQSDNFSIARILRNGESKRLGILCARIQPYRFEAYCECMLSQRGPDLFVELRRYTLALRSRMGRFWIRLLSTVCGALALGLISVSLFASDRWPPRSLGDWLEFSVACLGVTGFSIYFFFVIPVRFLVPEYPARLEADGESKALEFTVQLALASIVDANANRQSR